MKKKTKYIIEVSIYGVILGAIVLALLLAVINLTRTYDATIERNGTQKEATITLKYNLFGRFMGKMKGTILVETKDGLNSVEYTMKDQQISESRLGCFHTGSVWVQTDSENSEGRFYFIDIAFDEKLDNIVVYSTEDKYFIYSATEEFLELQQGRRKECANVVETKE